MTTQRDERIPQLTLGWRLRMSLGDISRDEIARIMEVTPSTISRWMSDKGAPPRRPYLVQWALATDVPVEWLEHGEPAQSGSTPPDDTPAGSDDALRRLANRKRGIGDGSTREYVVLPALAAAA